MRHDVNKIEKNFLFWKIYDKMCLKLINECVDEDIFFVNNSMDVSKINRYRIKLYRF